MSFSHKINRLSIFVLNIYEIILEWGGNAPWSFIKKSEDTNEWAFGLFDFVILESSCGFHSLGYEPLASLGNVSLVVVN